jgi:hypothetical protein
MCTGLKLMSQVVVTVAILASSADALGEPVLKKISTAKQVSYAIPPTPGEFGKCESPAGSMLLKYPNGLIVVQIGPQNMSTQ